jgi:aspartate/glutamate racemase
MAALVVVRLLAIQEVLETRHQHPLLREIMVAQEVRFLHVLEAAAVAVHQQLVQMVLVAAVETVVLELRHL